MDDDMECGANDNNEEDWSETWGMSEFPEISNVRENGEDSDTKAIKDTKDFSIVGSLRDAALEKMRSEEKEPLSRMRLNDNKAGMEGLDRERINQIIYEASKGSKFFENEKKREEQVNLRIEDQRKRLMGITEEQIQRGQQAADKLLQELENTRDLGQTIVHVDMDAFYAAVEMRDDPTLRNKPMAVGGMGMLSTSNYLARRYGVRAAMPGFIGKKLCPELVLVKSNFAQYTAVSQQIREIFSDYDPNFSPMSLDEAYLNITEHLEKRQTMSEQERTFCVRSCDSLDASVCFCDPNLVLASSPQQISTEGPQIKDDADTTQCVGGESKNQLSEINENTHAVNNSIDTKHRYIANEEKCEGVIDETDISLCKSCHKKKPSYDSKTYGFTAEETVQEMRCRIEQRTCLTASAGIAVNTLLSKVCSDRNKPNGQFMIARTRNDVMEFINRLPIRKVSGIGKVSERMLKAIGVEACADLYHQRVLLYHLYSPTAFHSFMRICLGLGSTEFGRDSERKSMSTERTFGELSKPADLYKKCFELCCSLSKDLQEEQIKGKTVTVKLKTVSFEVKSRAQTLAFYTSDRDAMFEVAHDLIKAEVQAAAPQPLRLRLMGVRMSSLLPEHECPSMKQDTLRGFFKKMATKLESQIIVPLESCESDSTEKVCVVKDTSEKSMEKLAQISAKNLELVKQVTSNHATSKSSFFGKIQQRNSTNSKLMQNADRNKTTVVTCCDNNDTASHNSTSLDHTSKTDSALTCPVCKKQDVFKNLQALNEHIDQCLSSFNPNGNNNENTCDSALCKNDEADSETMDGVEIKERASGKHVISGASSNAISSDESVNNKSSDELSSLRTKQGAKQMKHDLISVVREHTVTPEASSHRDDGHSADGSILCPVCNREQRSCDLDTFNAHVDACLSKGTIRDMLSEEKSRKRNAADEADTVGHQGKRRKTRDKLKMNTLDKFFK